MIKPRLLVVVPSPAYGGGEEYIFQLLSSEQFSNQFEIIVLSACADLNIKLRTLKINVYPAKGFVSFGLNTVKAILNINKIISKYSVDLVFLNGLPEIGVYSRYITSKSVTVVCHSNESWLIADNVPVLRRLKLLVAGKFYKCIFRLVVVSPQALKNVEKYGHGLFGKTVYIRNTVAPVNREKGRHIENLKCGEGVVFGRISRLCSGKGNEMLLKVFSKINKRYPDVRLLVSGDGEQRSYLEKLAVDLGVFSAVQFSGHVEKETFYRNIDCMLSPSDMEAMPMVIVEALSCGVPIIATNVGGVSSLIDDKLTGILIPPKDPDALYFSMEEFILNREVYDEYSARGVHKYSKEMSFSDLVTELTGVIGVQK